LLKKENSLKAKKHTTKFSKDVKKDILHNCMSEVSNIFQKDSN